MTEKIILIIDDEPYEQLWVKEFVEPKKIKAVFKRNVSDAIDFYCENKLNIVGVLVDLNIPIGNMQVDANILPIYRTFSGLIAAKKIRSFSCESWKMVIYSAHMSDELFQEVNKFGCEYIKKGQVKLIEKKILEWL